MSESPGVLQKKICMLGAYAVGKTSLVARFVRGIFSDKYLTTVGVKIDKKTLHIGDREVSLVLWDLAGEDDFLQVRMSYLRGSAGFLLVADGTRHATLEKAIELRQRAEAEIGEAPFILLINKLDLIADWEIKDRDIASLAESGWNVVATSARTGVGANEAFLTLARQLLGHQQNANS
jgi:small GTP-binding protein